MATSESERLRATDEAVHEQRLGSVLVTVGWVLIAMDCILAVWIWVGLRSGSEMWLWWAIGEGILGFALIFIGRHKRQAGAQVIGENSPRT
jgi:hypothetical protein